MDLRSCIEIGYIVCQIRNIKAGVEEGVICLGRLELRQDYQRYSTKTLMGICLDQLDILKVIS